LLLILESAVAFFGTAVILFFMEVDSWQVEASLVEAGVVYPHLEVVLIHPMNNKAMML